MLRSIEAVIWGSGNRVFIPPPPVEGWDVTTATYEAGDIPQSFPVDNEEGSPYTITFNPDGTIMYLAGGTLATVYQYTLTTPWDLDTMSYSGISLPIFTWESTPQQLYFNPTGTQLYVMGTAYEINVFSLSTAWNVSTGTFLSLTTLDFAQTNSSGFEFSSDGTKIYVVHGAFSDPEIYQHNLSVAWDVSTAVYSGKVFDMGFGSTEAVRLHPDGTKMYILNNDVIYQHTLSTAFDVSTATATGESHDTSADASQPLDIWISNDGSPPDGTKVFVLDLSGERDVIRYTLDTAWDISTVPPAVADKFSVQPQDGTVYGIEFKPDGTTMYMTGDANNSVFQYTLSTPWDIKTAAYASKFKNVALEDAKPHDVTFKPDGTIMYLVGNDTDSVYQYTLSPAWDVSTASYASKFKSIAEDTAPYDIVMNPDGTAMYIMGNANDTIFQYTLSTAWDVSTASYANKFKNVNAESAVPYGVAFKPDGTKMYTIDWDSNRIHQYTVTVAWDVSTAVYANKFYFQNQEFNPRSLAFKTDGTRMYITGTLTDTVFMYSLTEGTAGSPVGSPP